MVAPAHSWMEDDCLFVFWTLLLPVHTMAGINASWHSTPRLECKQRCVVEPTSLRQESHARNLKTLEGDWILNKARAGVYQSKTSECRGLPCVLLRISICLPACLTACVPTGLPTCLPACLSLSVCLSVCLSVDLHVYLMNLLSTCLAIYSSIPIPIFGSS